MIASSKALFPRPGSLEQPVIVRARRDDGLSPAAPARPLPADLWAFVVARKKFWLLPVLLPILMVGALIHGASIRRPAGRKPYAALPPRT